MRSPARAARTADCSATATSSPVVGGGSSSTNVRRSRPVASRTAWSRASRSATRSAGSSGSSDTAYRLQPEVHRGHHLHGVVVDLPSDPLPLGLLGLVQVHQQTPLVGHLALHRLTGCDDLTHVRLDGGHCQRGTRHRVADEERGDPDRDPFAGRPVPQGGLTLVAPVPYDGGLLDLDAGSQAGLGQVVGDRGRRDVDVAGDAGHPASAGIHVQHRAVQPGQRDELRRGVHEAPGRAGGPPGPGSGR